MNKKYQFCAEEMIILREALSEYKHTLTPGDNPSENRIFNYRLCDALRDQFATDIRLANKEI